ncbi:MAG: diadenylate cyclase CdaA [Candidatus Cloacimonetes bacterium]|nr:diadenylate cyclase CdaA [Candidatus Cloacimonadota bacterium]
MNFLTPGFNDIIDISLIALLLFLGMQFFKRNGNLQLFGFLLILLLSYFLTTLFELKMMTYVLNQIKNYWFLVFIILFQPEIRGVLAKFNQRYNLMKLFQQKQGDIYPKILNAVKALSLRSKGSLIVIERNNNLDKFMESGEILDSAISVKLLLTIFDSRSLLHDGAVVIRNRRIHACKVVLPLSENLDYTREHGTRHLAAIGISEHTDAVVVITSEETGRISLAKRGVLHSNLSLDELTQMLKDETK